MFGCYQKTVRRVSNFEQQFESIMKSNRILGLVAVLALCNLANVSAQDRPNREQFRERMMQRVREQMDVKDDADWKLISDRVTKVMDARREVGAGGGMGMMFGGGGRRGGGGGQGGDQAQGGGGGGRRGGPGGPGGFGEPSPEAEALQKALEAKASNDEVKAKLSKYREVRKEKREKLEKAQDDLRKVLSMRQEAAAVMLGLLD